MNDLTAFAFTSGLLALLLFLVLIVPLFYLLLSQVDLGTLIAPGSDSTGNIAAVRRTSAPRTAARALSSSRTSVVEKRPAKGRATKESTAKRAAKTKPSARKAPAKRKATTKRKPKPVSKAQTETKKPRGKSAATRKGSSIVSGARKDPELGYVFAAKPMSTDDLKKITGVGKVLERKLNEAGVYTFRQIALWDNNTLEAVAEKLSIGSRIKDGKWVAQCEKLHKERYGVPV